MKFLFDILRNLARFSVQTATLLFRSGARFRSFSFLFVGPFFIWRRHFTVYRSTRILKERKSNVTKKNENRSLENLFEIKTSNVYSKIINVVFFGIHIPNVQMCLSVSHPSLGQLSHGKWHPSRQQHCCCCYCCCCAQTIKS